MPHPSAVGGQAKLPVELNSFVGRNRELLEIRRLLAVTRTVTLTGPGGIGKSRLALNAAHRLGRYFADGARLVDFAELDSPDLVVQAVAHSLEVYEQPNVPIADSVLAHLRTRKLLLVLDNCEGLLDACRGFVSSVVSEGDGVRILCTSRRRLAAAGETVVMLPPLALPDVEQASLAALGEIEAIKLLADRASAVAPGFALADDNVLAARDICRRLDGLPLAIELAAARLSSIAPADLLERLDDRFRLLTIEHGQQSSRHQALRATVEWSHELLGEEERILWRRLSVFAGSFGIDAAEAVCSGEGLPRGSVLDGIASLVDQSILTMVLVGGRGRYRLLETMRLYGAERLRDAGEEAESQRRHAEWYAELISPGGFPRYMTTDQTDLLDELDLEWPNVEAALEHCAASAPDAGRGLGMAADLWFYWSVRGRYRGGLRHLETFLALVREPGATRAMALWASGFLEQAIGNYQAALGKFEQAREVSIEADGEREVAYALLGLGLAYLRLGNQQPGLEPLRVSHDTMTALEDDFGRAFVLTFLANAVAGGDQPEAARPLLVELLACSRRSGETFCRGLGESGLGLLEWLAGNNAAAEAHLREAVRLQNRLGHRWGIASSFEGLALVAASSGELERAALLLGASTALWQELGNELMPAWVPRRRRCEAAARAGLGEARYQSCLEQGLALALDRAVAFALEDELQTEPQASETDGEHGFQLTARELEVARLVSDGLSNPAIAAQLFLTRATVKSHVSHILQKLALDSRVQLAGWVAGHDFGPSRGDR
jgi:predicted ATPase/DNA-binding CsgD family transcriptional regulator